MHDALDGNTPREDLTAAERTELREAEALIAAVLAALPRERTPDLSSAIMKRIETSGRRYGTPAHADAAAPARHADAPFVAAHVPATPARAARSRGSILSWLWTPQSTSIAWRPAYALVLALLMATPFALPSMMAGAPEEGRVFTQFMLNAPEAGRVELAGDFTGWKTQYRMRESAPGVWTVVVPLEPGIHSYSFVIDGRQWVADPGAAAVDDGFGGTNSRLAVMAPEPRSM